MLNLCWYYISIAGNKSIDMESESDNIIDQRKLTSKIFVLQNRILIFYIKNLRLIIW